MKINFLKILLLGYLLSFHMATSSFASGTRDLLVKITWSSGASLSDFDMFIKSPDGKICNWGGEGGKKDQSEWGCVHLKDDQGTANGRSFEAFKIDLDKMDEYATKNNLLNKGGASDYKVYISRYTGPNVKVRFSYGDSTNCRESDSNVCPYGLYADGTPWEWNVDNTKIENAYYAVKYSPQYKNSNMSLETKPFSVINKTEQ